MEISKIKCKHAYQKMHPSTWVNLRLRYDFKNWTKINEKVGIVRKKLSQD